jgi:hypothetical protein
MTDGSLLCAVSSSLEEDPAEPGVNGLRENAEGVAVADLGEEVEVLLIRGRPRPHLGGGGPEEMD